MPAPINTSTSSSLLAEKALEIAKSQLGQQEQPKGTNSGPMVNEYLASVGLPAGYAWCQAFVHWCYQKAAQELNLKNPVIKTGGVLNCWNLSSEKNKIIVAHAAQQSENIKPGCQFILSSGAHSGHTGIVEMVETTPIEKEFLINTIEGNSNTDGGREGYEVVRHKRTLTDKHLLGFLVY